MHGIATNVFRRPSEFFGIEVHEFPNIEISFVSFLESTNTLLTADFKSKTNALKTVHNQPFPIFPVFPCEFRYFQ